MFDLFYKQLIQRIYSVKYICLEYLLLMILVTACTVDLQQEETNTTTSVLTYCETVEVEYIYLSNMLLDSSWQFNQYIDSISPESMDTDRTKFFDDIEINYKYKEEYVTYLENRVEYLTKIYNLISNNLNCEFPNDQSITIEQVTNAKDDLKAIVDK